MIHKYNIGDVIKIKLHKEIKYAVIIEHQIIIGSPAYEYIIQGIEGKKYWDSECKKKKMQKPTTTPYNVIRILNIIVRNTKNTILRALMSPGR